MSTLLLQLPARPRIAARHADAPPPAPAEDLEFALCGDDGRILRQGRTPLEALPDAHSTVLVMAPGDVGWHRLASLPRAPAARLRAALAGLLEEQLLEEEAEVHFALAPQRNAGEPAWVATVHAGWLRHWLERLETGPRQIDRVVPALVPLAEDAQACTAHVQRQDGQAWLSWCDAHGPLHLPLDSARALLASLPADQPVRWSASPEAAGAAADLAGMPVASIPDGQHLAAAAASGWNLRQFQFSPRRRADRLARAALSQALHDPAGRWLRLGLAGLLGIHLLGAGLWAWQQQQALAERKRAMNALLQTTFPKVRAIIDAPKQMARELEALRASAGRPGERDLETLLHAAAQAWPPGRAPATGLRFEPGRLSLDSPGWPAADLAALRSRLWPLGLDAEGSASGVVISPLLGAPPQAPGAGASGPAGLSGQPTATATATAPVAGPAGMRPAPGTGPAGGLAPARPGARPMPGPRPSDTDEETQE